jgi:hypothetical protein
MAGNAFGEGQGNVSSTSVCAIELLEEVDQCMYGVPSVQLEKANWSFWIRT